MSLWGFYQPLPCRVGIGLHLSPAREKRLVYTIIRANKILQHFNIASTNSASFFHEWKEQKGKRCWNQADASCNKISIGLTRRLCDIVRSCVLYMLQLSMVSLSLSLSLSLSRSPHPLSNSHTGCFAVSWAAWAAPGPSHSSRKCGPSAA